MPGFKLANGTGALDTVEFYTQYTWKVNFDGQGFRYKTESLIYLKDATLPTTSISQEIVQGASLEYKFAKSVAWDDITLTWYDNVGLLQNIIQWREMVWTPNDGLKFASDYKKDTVLTCYIDSDPANDDGGPGDSGTTQRYTLIGSWPSSIKHGNLSYTTSDIKVIEVTLTYDWADISIV